MTGSQRRSPIASGHCASADLARPPRARGRRRGPAGDRGGRRRRARVCGRRPTPTRSCRSTCRRSSRWPSAPTCTTPSATRSPCSSWRTASRSPWPRCPSTSSTPSSPSRTRSSTSHDGVNVRSLVRATLSNFASDSPQQGASTITMQVVKNDFLAGLERDGRYKLLQVHYALMLDREYTKDQILERYLNTVFFGNNAYGIQAAAETYFGKTADQLTFIEAAFLAGLVRSPSGYDPINNPERSRGRFVQVLDRLVDDGYITEAEATALGTDFVLPERARTHPRAPVPADLLHRGAARLPAQPLEHPRAVLRRALQHAVPWRPAHPHHVQPDPPGAGRGGPQHPARHAAGLRRRDRLAGDEHRRDPGDGRRPRLRAQRARGQHGAAAPPDRARASSCSCSPPRCRPAPSPTTSSTVRRTARSPCPTSRRS